MCSTSIRISIQVLLQNCRKSEKQDRGSCSYDIGEWYVDDDIIIVG